MNHMNHLEFFDIVKKELSLNGKLSLTTLYNKFRGLGFEDWEIKRHLQDLTLVNKIKVMGWNVELGTVDKSDGKTKDSVVQSVQSSLFG